LVWQANSSGYAHTSTSVLNCRAYVSVPVSPAGKKVTVKADFADAGTLAAADKAILWAGTDQNNNYQIHVRGQLSFNHELWKVVGGTWTFLAAAGTFVDGETDTIEMIISPTSVVIKEDGATIITQTTNLATFEITKAGIGCGGGQFTADDCNTALHLDNFSVQVERGDTLFCNAGDLRFPGSIPFTPPSASPSPSPSPAPTGQPTIELVGAVYGANRDVATAGDFTTADTIRDNCTLVLTWFRQTTAQNWCPYILDGSQEKAVYCGPYNNFGFMDGGSSSDTSNLGAMQYYFGGYFSSCTSTSCGLILRDDDATVPVFNAFGNNNEKLTDKGSYGDSTKFIDKWFNDFLDMPNSPSQLAAWTGTAASNSWNMTFMDNYSLWLIQDGGWSDIPIDPRRTGSYTQANYETDAIAGMTRMRTLADSAGKKLFCNIDGDPYYHYFERLSTYRTWVSKCDYVLLEQSVRDFGGNLLTETNWLRGVNIVKDIAKNTTTIPVIDFTNLAGQTYLWYAASTLLLGKEAGKGMGYLQANIPSAANLTKLKNLNCGVPVGDFFEVASSYYRRNWTSCIILVNPKTAATGSISLGGTYTNLETGASVTSISSLPAKSGVILYQ